MNKQISTIGSSAIEVKPSISLMVSTTSVKQEPKTKIAARKTYTDWKLHWQTEQNRLGMDSTESDRRRIPAGAPTGNDVSK